MAQEGLDFAVGLGETKGHVGVGGLGGRGGTGGFHSSLVISRLVCF